MSLVALPKKNIHKNQSGAAACFSYVSEVVLEIPGLYIMCVIVVPQNDGEF